jgi:hypothetical protein
MTEFSPDALPKFLIEIRDDGDVAAIVDDRVRGFEPAPGDAQGPGSYKAFVVVKQLDAPRIGRLPLQRPRVLVRSYGRTPQEAAALRWACSNAVHYVGPRTYANGLGIYLSKDDAGGEQEKDPDTKQPYQDFVLDAFASTMPVGGS